MKTLSTLLIIFFSINTLASGFDSLGGNEELLERAKRYKKNKKVRIVQKRSVDRYNRLELSLMAGSSAGGDAYYNTNQYGGLVDFHITPKFSVGYKYQSFSNSLNSEGERVFDTAQLNPRDTNNVIDLDFPVDSHQGVVSWYPIYGKTNFFDLTVIHFDIFTSLGAGTMNLDKGNSNITSFSAGTGIWWNNHLTSRFEINYQAYTDFVGGNTRANSLVSGNFLIGVLL